MPEANTVTSTRDRPLRARGLRTMQRLLDAGAEVFATKGFHAARVDDVVNAARTSHGTFYLYFANKEALFRALAEDVAGQMEGLADSLGRLSNDAAGRAELRGWLDRFAAVYERSGPVIAAWTAAETDSSAVGRIGTDLLGGFAAALGRRVTESGSDLDPDVAALALVAMIERFHYYALGGMLRADRTAVLDTLAAVTLAGIFGARSSVPAG